MDFTTTCPDIFSQGNIIKQNLNITDTVLITECRLGRPLVNYCPHNIDACRTGLVAFDDIPVTDTGSGKTYTILFYHRHIL